MNTGQVWYSNGQKCCARATLSTLTGGLPTIHIVPTEGFTKLRQTANLNETQVYPILILPSE